MSQYLPSSNAGKRALSELEKFVPFETVEELRKKFLSDLRMTPQDLARETGAPVGVIMEVIVCMNWMEDRQKYHKVATDSELMQYQELIREKRLPAVENQLRLLGRLNETINRLFDASDKTHQRIVQAQQDGASDDELAILYRQLPSAKELNDLANACEKANTIAGRLLNIRENLFEDKNADGFGAGNNFFLLPGATPVKAVEPTTIDVTPING
jgi:hypothetical protein